MSGHDQVCNAYCDAQYIIAPGKGLFHTCLHTRWL